LRPRRTTLRAALGAGALCLATTGAAEVPAAAQEETQGTPAGAQIRVDQRRLHIRTGRRAVVRGTVRPVAAGLPLSLQVRRKGRWRTLARTRTDPAGRYSLADRAHRPMSLRARVVAEGGAVRRLGRLNVYRPALASWYGPGLYGGHLGCGGTLDAGDLGVAHKTLPCGSKVTLRHGGRSVTVRVIDRGPYVGGREFDLTEATANRVGFRGHGTILSTR
jgi:rare lipoprotein A